VKHKVEGHQNLYKDESSGVIVNRSTVDRDRYRLAKRQSKSQMESTEEISKLKEEISEIKSLLKQLLSK